MTPKLTREQGELLRMIGDGNRYLHKCARDIEFLPEDALHGLVWTSLESLGITDAGREALAEYDRTHEMAWKDPDGKLWTKFQSVGVMRWRWTALAGCDEVSEPHTKEAFRELYPERYVSK